MKTAQRFALHFLVVILAIWIMFGFVFGLLSAPTADMYPRIDQGDMLLFYRLDKDVSAQDVVVFTKNDTIYVGRVIAAAGDTVEIKNNESVLINGSSMIESNIFYQTPIYEGFVSYPLVLGQDQCFILADSRNGGEDSRYFGPVNKKELLGTVITVLRRNNI
ncbi:MAG: signal peptidase I [Lachnospiraceae bacterium]|nr:signal peptidase I [Lachnospiraceae bacterium]